MTLCIEAKGTALLHFTWLHDDKVVEGADGPVLTLNGVNEADSGSYVCQVENQVGKTVSKPAKLQVGECGCILRTAVNWGVGGLIVEVENIPINMSVPDRN